MHGWGLDLPTLREVQTDDSCAAIYGAPMEGVSVPVVEVPVELAELFASAHALVHREPAASHAGDGRLRQVSGGEPGAWQETDPAVVEAIRAAERPVMLAGPGVVHAGCVPGLHALAATAHLGVLNTWGAKGIFDWRSRHHLATAGLQELDFRLGGLADSDLIIASGIDEAEAGDGRWRLAPVVEVPPGSLAPLAEQCGRSPQSIEMPPLRTRLTEVTQRGWASTAVPIPPSLATRNLGAVIGARGLLTADGGHAGYWVARTYATTGLGTVIVPADVRPGLALACAAVARLRNPARPVLTITDGPWTDVQASVTDAAAQLGVALAVERWEPDGDVLTADAHAERLTGLVRTAVATTVSLAIDPSQLGEMAAAAGPVIAWPALDFERGSPSADRRYAARRPLAHHCAGRPDSLR